MDYESIEQTVYLLSFFKGTSFFCYFYFILTRANSVLVKNRSKMFTRTRQNDAEVVATQGNRAKNVRSEWGKTILLAFRAATQGNRAKNLRREEYYRLLA